MDTLICFGERLYNLYETSGQYSFRLRNKNNCDSIVIFNLTVDDVVEIPTFAQNGDVLTSSATGNLQWYINGEQVNNATGQQLTITKSGEYQVEVTNENGCSAISAGQWCVKTGVEDLENGGFEVFPNPATKRFFIQLKQNTENAVLKVFTASGKMVFDKTLKTLNGNHLEISTENWGTGIYHVNLQTKNGSFVQKVVVSR